MFLLPYIGCSQEWKKESPQVIVDHARSEAGEGDYTKAREKLQYILKIVPDHQDARIQLGRSYAWEGRYDEAIRIYDEVLSKNQDNLNALMAKIDAQAWSGRLNDAQGTADLALEYHPGHEEVLFRKAQILSYNAEVGQAIEILDEVLRINPANLEAFDLKIKLEEQSRAYAVVIRFGVDVFDQAFDPALNGSIEVNKEHSWGAVIARVNYAHRFKLNGAQYEMDFYPAINDKVYGYVNYGFSQSVLFSNHRMGAEVFAVVLNKLETSIGARYLQFTTQNILTYTASMRYYCKSMEFSVRPFYTHKKSFTAASIDFEIKKNFKQTETFIELSTGFGFSPDIRFNQTFTGQSEQFYTLESRRIGLKIQKRFGDRWNTSLESRMNYRELSEASNDYLLITSIISSIRYKI